MDIPRENLSQEERQVRRRRISMSGVEPEKDVEEIARCFNHHLHCTLMTDRFLASDQCRYKALARYFMDILSSGWVRTCQRYDKTDPKRVYYLSLEFFMGRTLTNTVINLKMQDCCKEAMHKLGLEWEELEEAEVDAGLGNGGLGRLAACFMDSMATLEMPAMGYGIRYDYGMFKQIIKDGWQVEETDDWLRHGNVWEACRRDEAHIVHVRIGGTVVEHAPGMFRWEAGEVIHAVPYDTPVPGYNNNVVNTLRLWSAEAPVSFHLQSFHDGNYDHAVAGSTTAQNISRVLYPNDNTENGKNLRLKQEMFLVMATLHDIVRRFKRHFQRLGEPVDFSMLPQKAAIQLNDTHPAMAVPELMRILVDEEGLHWDTAWALTLKTCAYTNHTVLPEALEKWEVGTVYHFFPRHAKIIMDINHYHLERVERHWGPDCWKKAAMSIVQGSQFNMAFLAVVGSHAINGVAAIHSDIIRNSIFKDFNELYPGRFQNKTNGITPRRWLKLCNPKLAAVITKNIGEGWITDLTQLRQLERFAQDDEFLNAIMTIKQDNKHRLADMIERDYGIQVARDSIFDVQVKRIHEYKRQLLNVLHVITLFNRLRRNPQAPFQPRTVIIGGKAAPSYHVAKMIIKLITSVAARVNNDPAAHGLLKVVYMENYGVSLAEKIIPAADLSEQISLAGTEASGTGNMKFMLNGALTLGTLDGANVEMREEVGDDNIFIFGMTVDDVNKEQKSYRPREVYLQDEELRECLEELRTDTFCPDQPGIFHGIYDNLMHEDRYMVLKDYRSYVDTHDEVTALFQNKREWARKCLLNIAASGKFSSDRTIMEYARDIWGVDWTDRSDHSADRCMEQ